MKNAIRFLIFLFILVLNSCSSKKEIKPISLVCLVDFSQSIPTSTLDWYKMTIKNDLIKNLGAQDRLVILPIDFGSQTSSKEIYYSDLSIIKFKKELDSPISADKLEQRRLTKHLDSIATEFTSSFDTTRMERVKFSKGTDVFGGIAQANKYFDSKTNNLVVVFSDMIQETNEFNFTRELKSEKSIKSMLDKIPENDLVKFDMIILTGEQPKLSVEFFNLLKEFWSQFSLKQGINLVEYDSGGKTILLNKIRSYKNL